MQRKCPEPEKKYIHSSETFTVHFQKANTKGSDTNEELNVSNTYQEQMDDCSGNFRILCLLTGSLNDDHVSGLSLNFHNLNSFSFLVFVERVIESVPRETFSDDM